MARHGRAQHLSLFLLLTGVGHILCQLVHIETGKDYTFNPGITTAFESVLWKFNNDKVVEFEDGKVKWFQFKDQGHFDEKTGILTLNGLSEKQSGGYESEILVNGELKTKKYEIKVIDAVQEPQVNCVKNDEGRVTSLECFLEPEVDGAEFTWDGPGEKKNIGKKLEITEEITKDTLLFCTAKNPVSEKHTEFKFGKCEPGPVVNIGAIVGGVVIGLLLLVGIVIGVAVYFRKKRTRAGYTTTPPDDEEARTGILMQNNISNCTKEDVKELEVPNNIGNGKIEKEDAEQEDQDVSGSENPKTDLPNTVNHSDERAEEDQEMPKCPEKGQGDTPTPQETPDEDKNSMDETNGVVVPPLKDEPEPVTGNDSSNEESAEVVVPPLKDEPEPVTGNDTSNEESAEGQSQSEDTALLEASSQDASRVRGTIAQFESMAWKPREVTTRNAGQKNSAA